MPSKLASTAALAALLALMVLQPAAAGRTLRDTTRRAERPSRMMEGAAAEVEWGGCGLGQAAPSQQ